MLFAPGLNLCGIFVPMLNRITAVNLPIPIAHRGVQLWNGKVQAPENTLPAFALVKDKALPMVEFDVQLSKDEELVIIHDYTVDRTTDRSGRVVDLTLAELKACNAAASFHDKTPCSIPTLQELLDLLAPTGSFRTRLNILAL